MKNNQMNQYKWYILILGVLSHIFAVAIPYLGIPVLFSEIAEDLKLSLVQLGSVWGIASLAGLFASLVGGVLGDRFGCKRTLAVSCLLGGLLGSTRGFSNSFISLFLTMFCFSLGAYTVTLTVHKTTFIWFPRNQLGLANGILAGSMGVGIALGSSINATVMSPVLGGWRNVIFFWSLISIVLAVLWSFTRREPGISGSGISSQPISFLGGLSHVIRIKSLWILAISASFFIACQLGMFGYLPLFLRNTGWAATKADIAFSLIGLLGAIGAISISFTSDRLGSRKKILMIIQITVMICLGLLSIANFYMIWIIIIAIGLCREAYPALSATFLLELKEIDGKFIGTALGLRGSVSMIGGLIGPPIGNSLAGINPGFPFLFWAGLAFISTVLLLMVQESD